MNWSSNLVAFNTDNDFMNYLLLLLSLIVTVVVVVVITPPLPRDGSTAQMAIQVYTVNLIEIRLGERWQLISNQP